MPTQNVFNRTICFIKETNDQGRKRFKRIPWDLIQLDGYGPLISPTPYALNTLSEVKTTDTINPNVADLLNDEDESNLIDEVVDILYFESEQAFCAKFGNTFGYYKGNETQSVEFGYPNAYPYDI